MKKRISIFVHMNKNYASLVSAFFFAPPLPFFPFFPPAFFFTACLPKNIFLYPSKNFPTPGFSFVFVASSVLVSGSSFEASSAGASEALLFFFAHPPQAFGMFLQKLTLTFFLLSQVSPNYYILFD
jgi:hypothetical protein